MNLVVYAIPFFALAIVLELIYGWLKQRNTYRLNDSVSSLFLGVLSQAQRFVTLGVGGVIYLLITDHFSTFIHSIEIEQVNPPVGPTPSRIHQGLRWHGA